MYGQRRTASSAAAPNCVTWSAGYREHQQIAPACDGSADALRRCSVCSIVVASQYADFGPLISFINFFADQLLVLPAGEAAPVGKATCVCGNATVAGLSVLLAAEAA
jgi:hypothetical protein